MSQTSELVLLDISIVSILFQFVCPCRCAVFNLIQRDSFIKCVGSTVLLPVIVVFFIGYAGLEVGTTTSNRTDGQGQV